MSKHRILNSAGITAAIGLAALPVFLTLSPMFGTSEANAEPSTIGAAATIVPNLSLSAQNVSMVMTPTGSGTVFKTASVDATVSTNNETGYTLYFSDKDDNTSLKHSNLADTAIASTEDALSGNAMLPNTWGYTLTPPAAEGENEINNSTNLGLTYSSIPTDYTTIKTRDTQTTPSETSKLTFGVKIDNSIPSGTYSDEILISAVINYSSAGYDQSQLWLDKNGMRITTMQQMTGDICASVPTPTVSAVGSNVPEITLEDTRDGKNYKVRKLVDGNCWMAEDLKIAGQILEPTKTNVKENFNLPAATSSSSSAGYTLAAPVVVNDGWDDAMGTTKTTHLYNWYAATAGSMPSTGSASQDVCPKGWHLPDNGGNGSWNKLLRQGQGGYEVATSNNTYSAAKAPWGSFNGAKNPTANPIGLHVTGALSSSNAIGFTTGGYYWSRTAAPDGQVYYLDANYNTISPQHTNNKGNGYAVRCVAEVTSPDETSYMQEVTSCPSSLPLEKGYTLRDKRDNKEYTIARLADGNCWMTSDLAIEDYTLTYADSNVTQDFSLPVSTGHSSTSNTYVESMVANDGKGGTYLYNWYAATAAVSDVQEIVSGNASQDICPKGWHLPNNSGDGSWNKLLRQGQGAYEVAASDDSYKADKTSWGSYDAFKNVDTNPLRLHLTGTFVNSGSELLWPTGGYYWTRTATSTTFAHDLGFDSNKLYVQGNVNKNHGFAVRCVLGS